MYNAIKYLYPDIKDSEFLLQDNSDGKGVFISKWEYSSQQPTIEELKAVQVVADALALAPALKQEALKTLTVTTTSGKVFDGNETARVNMLSAITAAAIIGQTTANWKLADNTTALVTLDEIKEALTLAIKRVGEIVTE